MRSKLYLDRFPGLEIDDRGVAPLVMLTLVLDASDVGAVLHCAIGLIVAIAYAFAFEGWGGAGIVRGAALGLLHGAFVLVVGMELLPAWHPRMASRHHGPTPTRQLEPPGFLALNYGRATPVVTLVAHVLYGVVLDAFYHAGS